MGINEIIGTNENRNISIIDINGRIFNSKGNQKNIKFIKSAKNEYEYKSQRIMLMFLMFILNTHHMIEMKTPTLSRPKRRVFKLQ